MLIECRTREMNLVHLKAVLDKGSWSITYNPSYVEQTMKPSKPTLAKAQYSSLPGRVLSSDDPIMRLWGPNSVLLGPNRRCSKEQYPFPTSDGRFDTELQAERRILEDKVLASSLRRLATPPVC